MKWIFVALVGVGISSSVTMAAAAEPKPHVVFVINETEYEAAKTLPAIARLLEDRYGCRTTVLDGAGKPAIPGLEALDNADLMVLFARRCGLPKDQMARVRKYLKAGRPLVALRTASHAFAPPKEAIPGVEYWPTFDTEVLGCHYHGHGPNDKGTDVAIDSDAARHPILKGVTPTKWHSRGSLYFSGPLDKYSVVLLTGSEGEHTEPVAWTQSYKGGYEFYTSLGHKDDFEQPQFRTLLVNAVFWAMNRPVPPER